MTKKLKTTPISIHVTPEIRKYLDDIKVTTGLNHSTFIKKLILQDKIKSSSMPDKIKERIMGIFDDPSQNPYIVIEDIWKIWIDEELKKP